MNTLILGHSDSPSLRKLARFRLNDYLNTPAILPLG